MTFHALFLPPVKWNSNSRYHLEMFKDYVHLQPMSKAEVCGKKSGHRSYTAPLGSDELRGEFAGLAGIN